MEYRVLVGGEIWPEDLAPPATEWRFAPGRKYAFDFAWPSERVAVEIEGGAWKTRTFVRKGRAITVMGGRHNSGVGFIADMEKYNLAVRGGWRVLRFLPGKIDYEMVREVLRGESATTP